MNKRPESSLPDEILEHLDFSEIPETQRVWDLSAGCVAGEPSAEEFELAGKDMWPLIQDATRPKLRRIVTWRRSMAMAACIAVILSVGITLTQRPASVEAPFGKQVTHELPDGSSVILNSGTKIKYSRKFGDSSRELTLAKGEIYLDVTRDTVPFIVESFDASTEVLGTSFNVRSWPEEIGAATDVTVKSGQVRVTPLTDPDMAVTLMAGEFARIQPDGKEPLVGQASDGSSEESTWVDGVFKFFEQPLGNIAEEIERRYDVDIAIETQALANMSIGILKESPESAEEIIQDICALHCTYRVTSDGFLLSPP